MTTIERIQEQVQHLSEPLQQEVLDFVEYLRLKQVKHQRPTAQQDTTWSKEMREVLTEFRQVAAGYSEAEIDQFVDEAVAKVRGKKRQRKTKVRE